jgi:hypothetical protein
MYRFRAAPGQYLAFLGRIPPEKRVDRAIDDPGPRLAPLTGSHPDLAAEQIMPVLPGTVLPPAPKVLVDELPGGEVVRQQAPGTATTEARENGIQNFARRILLRSAPGFGGGDQMLNQRPFAVAEISWVRSTGFHTPILLKMVHPKQAF